MRLAYLFSGENSLRVRSISGLLLFLRKASPHFFPADALCCVAVPVSQRFTLARHYNQQGIYPGSIGYRVQRLVQL